jgi:DNA invertase Pin-like site-specific DNA recombinase
MVRHLRARQALDTVQEQASEQLLPEQFVAYIRQSSTKQVENNPESADLQLSGAQEYAVSQGLDADKLVIAWEGDGKRGVSGTLRIDQRDDLRDIMAGIYAGKIKRVWGYSVSRLFRDKYGVQVATFIQACAEHHVKVVIKTAKTFDFSNSFDTMMFQFLANVAARENEDRARLLHEANRNKALRGEYDGRALTPGFIVDRDKTSPTYNKYIPYEPHKRVVNRLLARYAEHGEMNRMAREVERMRVVFPPFEDWVDQLNITKFEYIRVCAVHGPDRRMNIRDKDGKGRFVPNGCQFKGEDCKFIGYHISSQALEHLLITPELMGYWTISGKNPDGTEWREVLTDANGEPLVNHTRIVDKPANWEYVFKRLSPTLLDGTPNPNRINARATWRAATVKQVDREPQALLLDGILTSPLGTVHLTYDKKYYFVYEKNGPSTRRRKNTLSIHARWIEDEFRKRLLDRIDNTDYEQILYDALRETEAKNREALVSVNEQIANYQQTIEIKQAKLDALGKDFDIETAKQYNQAIKDARANIAALQAKKNEAAAEEKDLQDLCTELRNFRNHGKRDNLNLRRFLQIITDSVSIDEYSSHFITLTVIWCTPFAQKDVCYFCREDGGRTGWSKEDERDLRRLYPNSDRLDIMKRFPTKTWRCIVQYAANRHIGRNTNRNSSGIHDPIHSLADWELMQKYGWKRERAAHWLPGEPLEKNGDLSKSS